MCVIKINKFAGTKTFILQSFINSSSSSSVIYSVQREQVDNTAKPRHKTINNFEFGGYLSGKDGRQAKRAAPHDLPK